MQDMEIKRILCVLFTARSQMDVQEFRNRGGPLYMYHGCKHKPLEIENNQNKLSKYQACTYLISFSGLHDIITINTAFVLY